MASFLGMSVGLMTATSRRDLARTVIPMLATAIVVSRSLSYVHRYGKMTYDVGGQGSPQQVYFGTEYGLKDPSLFVIPIEVIAGGFFLLVAGAFVGLGQAMGRAFDAIPNRVSAYTIDILGSLSGIVAFGLASYFRLPPYAWFAVATGLCLLLIRRLTAWQIGAQWLLLCARRDAGLRREQAGPGHLVAVLQVEYNAAKAFITTNNIGHQAMTSVDEEGPAYALPNLLARDAGAPPFSA